MADQNSTPALSAAGSTIAPTAAPPVAPIAAPPRNFPEGWAAKKGTEYHWLCGARAHGQWQPSVTTVTEAEFDAAVQAVKDIRVNSIHGPTKAGG